MSPMVGAIELSFHPLRDTFFNYSNLLWPFYFTLNSTCTYSQYLQLEPLENLGITPNDIAYKYFMWLSFVCPTKL